MKNFFTFLSITLLTCFSINDSFGQDCWERIRLTPYRNHCYGSQDGYVRLEYKTSLFPYNNPIYCIVTRTSDGSIVTDGFLSGYDTVVNIPLTETNSFKFLIYQLYDSSGQTQYRCHSVSYFSVIQPACDLNIDYLNINQDPASPDFLRFTGRIDGTFCGIGWESHLYKKVNSVEVGMGMFRNSVNGGDYPYYLQDTIISESLLGPLIPYPGDTVQIAIDNSNESGLSTPSAVCRVYSNPTILECDLWLDSFSIQNVCGLVNIKGKLKSKYLKLINNNDNLDDYTTGFFDFIIEDSLNNVIGRWGVSDTSGNFIFDVASAQFIGDRNYFIKWKLGHCYFEYSFSIPATNSMWIGAVNNEWENPGNWDCGVIPDGNTDVTIDAGEILVNSNASCRSLSLKPNVNFTVNPDFNLTIFK